MHNVHLGSIELNYVPFWSVPLSLLSLIPVPLSLSPYPLSPYPPPYFTSFSFFLMIPLPCSSAALKSLPTTSVSGALSFQ